MRPSLWARPTTVAAIYLAIALVVTWPLVTVLPRQLVGDLGDTVFNCWVILWTSGQLVRALHGDWAALDHYWNANIFYPQPLTLAYSEHLTPQMLQALPVLATTGNIVLAYNLVFLATIVLSGLGAYLLVRDITGEPLAGFLAGLAFAFTPFRVEQIAHIEVLSSQWMPFAFYGLRRFIISGRLRPLVGGSAALLAQGLSCGYYLAYFTPFAVAYCLVEMGAQHKLADGRTWRGLVAAGSAVLFVVIVFLFPYFELRSFGEPGLGTRPIGDVQFFSADTHAFATAPAKSRVWGSRIRAMPHEQGQGFPGFGVLGFAIVGLGVGAVRASRAARRSAPSSAGWRRLLAIGLTVIFTALGLIIVRVLVTGHVLWEINGIRIRYSFYQTALEAAVAGGALLIVSPRLRRLVRGVPGSPVALYAWSALAAAWLSLGPTMYASGRPIGRGLYDLFYRWAPGFNGLRVPSLNFMLVTLFLAVLAGIGGAAILQSRRAAGRVAIAVAAVVIVAEGTAVDFMRAAPVPSKIYEVTRTLPPDAVLAEFPFGDTSTDIRYTFFSGFHRRPTINGFSGFFPFTWWVQKDRFSRLPSEGWVACQVLRASGATHVIIHEADYKDDDGPLISAWMERCGGEEIAASGTDRAYQIVGSR